MSLRSDIRAKSKLLNREYLLPAVEKLERGVYKLVRGLLGQFATERGRLLATNENRFTLLRLDTPLLNFLGVEMGSLVPDYVEDFDELERLNRAIYSGLLTPAEAATLSRLNFSAERTYLRDEVIRSLTSLEGLRTNVVLPVRKILYRGITFRTPIREIESQLRTEILSKDSSSRLLRYSRQVTQDAVSQFDGAINDRIRDDLQLDGIVYVGSLIKTSRSNCRELVQGSGRFGDLAVEPGMYRVADLPKIVDRARGRSGWNEACTPETFAQFRGGWGCRHECYYIRLENEESRSAIKKAYD